MAEKRTLLTRTSMYFEDYEVGQTVTSPGRTITEADVVTFAGLSGDFNSIHTDAEYAAGQPYGRRVAHGLLGMSIGVGLIIRLGFIEETILGFREIDGWKFSAPIFLGDTIHVEAEVSQTRAIHRLGGGLVTLQVEIRNQAGKVVQQGNWSMLVKSKESEKG
jgi:3-hydroxybutyryl-CoA dehydratase